MVHENPARQYIVRTSGYVGGREYHLWAFTAEDAKVQVRTSLEGSDAHLRPYITYVGPLNPDCKCLGECRCGILEAPREV